MSSSNVIGAFLTAATELELRFRQICAPRTPPPQPQSSAGRYLLTIDKLFPPKWFQEFTRGSRPTNAMMRGQPKTIKPMELAGGAGAGRPVRVARPFWSLFRPSGIIERTSEGGKERTQTHSGRSFVFKCHNLPAKRRAHDK